LNILQQLLFCIAFFISFYFFGFEFESHDLFNSGFYTKSINELKKELTSSSNVEKKSRIHYHIAYSYYAMCFVEDYKKHLDSANFFASRKKHFSIEDKAEYAIGLIRYYNYEVKPKESLSIYKKIYPEFHRADPMRKSKLWIKLYQNIATTRRNTDAKYEQMNAEYDSAYFLIKKHHLENTLYEIDYCKSRGNMNLDKVNPSSDELYYRESRYFFEKAIQILKRKQRLNLPIILGFYNSLGLVSYMKADLEVSNAYFDSAYLIMQKLKYYHGNDFQAASLNTFNLSTLTRNLIFKKSKDIRIIQNQLQKLRSLLPIYEVYSKKNVDVDLLVFTDMYGYSPYNAMVSCYNNLFLKTRNKHFLDSSFYYAEINRTQWVKNAITFSSFYKKLDKLFAKNYVLIQYGEFGFIHNKYAYAIVKSNLGSKYVHLGKITNLNLDKLNLVAWNTSNLKLHSEVYFRFFQPLEKYIPKNTKKVLITKSPFMEQVNLESLVTDSTGKKVSNSFLIYKYPIFMQPSFRLFSESSIENISTVNSIFPDYMDRGNLSTIHFTKDVFTNWVYKNKLKRTTANSKKSDLQLIAAHASSGSHRIDYAYMDKGLSKLSIRRICKSRIPNSLTILAVCEGGVGQTISSGSSFSIASAYLFSGAKSCVYSNSVLDDKVGAEILSDFLQRLENGEQKDWALRNTKLDYLKKVTSEEGYNPIYWAGLQVMGDVSPVEIDKSYVIWYFTIGLTLLVGLGFVIKRRLRLRSV
jgi:hypothetical protein